MEADIIVAGASISTLIVSIIQLTKMFFPEFTKKAAPFIAIILGLIATYCYNLDVQQYSLFEIAVLGISMGFQATGIYAATTASAKDEKRKVEVELQQMSINQTMINSRINSMSSKSIKSSDESKVE